MPNNKRRIASFLLILTHSLFYIFYQWQYSKIKRLDIDRTIIVSSELNASGEHELYYSLMNLFDYPHTNPTHGELVSIGTLLTAKILGLKTGDFSIFIQLTSAYKKIDLPTNFEELEKIGVTKDQLTIAFDQLKGSDSLLAQEFNMSLLNDCFAS